QPTLCRFDQSLRGLARLSRFSLVTHAEELDELPLAREQVGAVDRQQRGIFINELARCGDIEFLNVTINSRYELPAAGLVGHDQTDRSDRVKQRLALHACVTNTDLLLALYCDDEIAVLIT